jgi:hypothetical protein
MAFADVSLHVVWSPVPGTPFRRHDETTGTLFSFDKAPVQARFRGHWALKSQRSTPGITFLNRIRASGLQAGGVFFEKDATSLCRRLPFDTRTVAEFESLELR